MTTTSKLFTPWRMGPFVLANRVVMAPMTRNRADDDGVPGPSAAEYYRQRAGAGLIVTEATQPSETGRGYLGTPGLHDDAQQEAWAPVATAVHTEGGTIFGQLMHAGRIGHPSFLPGGALPVAPSAIRAAGQIETSTGMADLVTPRALAADELPGIAADFAAAASRAVAAGLDGVELHAANGYLLHQFLSDSTNVRDDAYGGSPARRARFVVEVAAAVAAAIGPERVGLRISPGGQFNDMAETQSDLTYPALVAGLAPLGLAYLHSLRRRSTSLHATLRRQWPGTYILNTGFLGSSDMEELEPILESGAADLVSVGRYFISNPDLVERWRTGAPLSAWDEDTFFTGGDRGYIDYPTLSQQGGHS